MAKKGVKRPAQSNETAEKPQKKPQEKAPLKKKEAPSKVVPTNGLPSKKPKIEKKTNDKVADKQPKEVPTPNTTSEVKPKSKKLKKVKKEAAQPTAEDKKDKVLEVVQKRLSAKEKKKQKLQKAKENGQTKIENRLSAEEIKARIEEINKRETISKTARRRLGALKKKLRIAEGTYEPDFGKGPKLSKSLKRNLRRQKNALEKSELPDKIGAVPIKEKQKILEEKAATVSQLVQQERNKQIVAAVRAQANDKNNKKQAKKQKGQQKKNDDDDDDSSDEESDDDVVEDESDEEEESEAADSTLNTTQEDGADEEDDDSEEDEEEDDDDEDEDEDEKDEEEEEKPQIKQKPVKNAPTKVEKVQNNKNVKSEKQNEPKQNADKKTRYVLFVGNLPYSVTQDDIRKHFLTKVSSIASVRIPNERKTNKPRGFAYVELTNSEDYEKGLSLHQSDLQGRKINVQYTSGGSKSAGKNPEVVAKNKKLHAMRKQGMLAGSVKESNKRSIRRKKQKPQAV